MDHATATELTTAKSDDSPLCRLSDCFRTHRRLPSLTLTSLYCRSEPLLGNQKGQRP
jgi:hypothetical protein